MPKGFMGKVLWVDLTAKTVSEEVLDEQVYRQFLGGYGLGAHILYKRMAPGVDPLGPDNILGFVPGLLTGTGTPFSGRFSVVCKSPLTGGWGDANCGGFFGPELRRCGYDGLFITGAAEAPVYLTIYKENVEFHDAADLMGTDAPSCEAELQRRHGANWQVATIGQAGEKLSLISGIVTDRGRIAARSGVGAVMGSKRLKAIACKGHLAVSKAEMEAFKASTQAIMSRMHPMEPEIKNPIIKLLADTPHWMRKWIFGRLGLKMQFPHPTVVWGMANQGTTAVLSLATESGDCPVKNWSGIGSRDFPYERAVKISDAKATQFNTGFYACSACPLHCGAEIKVDDPEFQIHEGHRVEYETIAGLGASLLIDHMAAIQYGHHLCNIYGLDAISVGGVLGFAFECFEKGIITEQETGGLALRWGDHKAMIELIHQIGHRRHIGAVLADGVKRAAEQIGHGAEALAMHVGGQELPYHDPKLTKSFATTYVADPTPGRHTAGGAVVVEALYKHPVLPVKLPKGGHGPLQAMTVKAKQVQAATGMCEFSEHIGSFPYTTMIQGATGWRLSDDDLLEIGDRIQTLRQAFNCREGIKPADWRLPDRVSGKAPLTAGPLAGVTVDVEGQVRAYLSAMEYDPASGLPSERKLRRLGLDHAAAELYHGQRPGSQVAAGDD